jgi:hypothetical protein
MSVHEALAAEGALPRTVMEGRLPTPVLVRGVERRCAIETSPASSHGRPRGLYGNEFERARIETILAATRVLDPPPCSNILAIMAPAGGRGRYTSPDIGFILRTACAGFGAARRASAEAGFDRVGIHTGYWGCGAYGGDRVLMTRLQCIAAQAAGVDRLILHVGNDGGAAQVGRALADDLIAGVGESIALAGLIGRVERLGLGWGTSNRT